MPPVRSATSRSTRSVRGIGRGRDLAPDLRDGQLRQRQKRRVDVGEKVGSLVGVKDGKECKCSYVPAMVHSGGCWQKLKSRRDSLDAR